MRDVQWSETGGESRSREGATAALGADGGGSVRARGSGGSWGVTPRGGEEVRRMDPVVARGSASDSGRFAHLWPLLWLIWLPNLGVPLIAMLHARPTPLRLGAVVAGLALFVAVSLWASWHNDLSRAVYPTSDWQVGRWRWVPVAVLAGVSVALVLGDGPRWLVLLIFIGACAGGRFALGRALWVLAALMLLTGLLGWLAHDPVSDIGPTMFWTGMAGVLTIIVSYLRLTNRALHVAREENARLAVEAERLRFARDLHDLLGHDLALIALKGEVAEYLIPTAPEQAVAAVREMEDVARTALREIRATVAGYRQPTLASELRGSGEILAAAGIAYRCKGERIAAPPAVEAVLAWAAREGVTNAVKHSGARRCTIRTTRDASSVGIEVRDDGPGAGATGVRGVRGAASLTSTPGQGGNGLLGLAERAVALGGRCDAGPCPDGGFRLAVTLPVAKDTTKETGAEHATVEHAIASDRGGRL